MRCGLFSSSEVRLDEVGSGAVSSGEMRRDEVISIDVRLDRVRFSLRQSKTRLRKCDKFRSSWSGELM